MSTLTPRSAVHVIYQGDDMGRLADLRRAADIAERLAEQDTGSAKRLGDTEAQAEVQAAQDAYDAFVDEAAERAVTVELKSIGRRRFRDLMAEHPPRKVAAKPSEDDEDEVPTDAEVDHPDDAGFGVNIETFGEALLTYIDADDPTIRTITAPDFAGRKAVAAFIDDELADGDFDSLWVTAYALNRQPSADPKASRFSAAPRSSTET